MYSISAHFLVLLNNSRVNMDNRISSGSWIRCVNFHHTPHTQVHDLEKLFYSLTKEYSPVTLEDLVNLTCTGVWSKSKPGILPAFYNGYRNNFDIAYRLLEKVGLTGWFFVVTDGIDLPDEEQIHFASTHRFNIIEREYPDDRQVLSSAEIQEMSLNHVICSHTASHSEVLDDSASDATMQHEIINSADVITRITGKRPPAFCWLLGEPYSNSPMAHPYLKAAGYQFLFGSQSIELLP